MDRPLWMATVLMHWTPASAAEAKDAAKECLEYASALTNLISAVGAHREGLVFDLSVAMSLVTIMVDRSVGLMLDYWPAEGE